MSYNFTTTITWVTLDEQLHSELHLERLELLDSMIAQGVTNGSHSKISDTVSVRHFSTREAAGEYITNMQAIAAKYNVTIVSAEIGEVPDNNEV
jgi:hypothetical protein